MLSLRNQIAIWIGVLLIGILLLWMFRSFILPFVVGLALAYLLNPLVTFVQRSGLARGWATSLVLLVVLGLIVGIFFIIVPMIVQQVSGLVQRLPDYFSTLRELANQWIPALNAWLGPERAHQLETGLDDFLTNAPALTATITTWLASSGWTLLNQLGIIIITPVVAFYLLLDWEKMIRGLDNLLPRDHRVEVRSVIDEMDRSMAGVIRGQGSVILVLCIYYSTALSLAGLSFGLAIGLIAGLFSFIPFFGFLTGFVLSMGIAIVQFWPNWVMVAVVALVFGIGQFLEGNVLYPKLVGSSIGINPVWLMFALFAFAFLFGFVGLLLAVPLSAMSAVLLRWGARKYRESALYLGQHATKGIDTRAAE
jgi:predicted PurR-regulated permease PerM